MEDGFNYQTAIEEFQDEEEKRKAEEGVGIK